MHGFGITGKPKEILDMLDLLNTDRFKIVMEDNKKVVHPIVRYLHSAWSDVIPREG